MAGLTLVSAPGKGDKCPPTSNFQSGRGEFMLKALLGKRRDQILSRWFQLTLESYPPEARKYFANENHPFSNPVGAAVAEGLRALWEALLLGDELDLPPYFVDLMKVRAVQEFKPSAAVGFVPGLKKVIREALAEELEKDELGPELIAFETRIDAAALLAFDAYMQARERLFEVRANELQHRYAILFERMGISADLGVQCPSSLEKERK